MCSGDCSSLSVVAELLRFSPDHSLCLYLAMSQGPEKLVTQAEVVMAREILARLERQSAPVELSAGSMHDGSKRLRETEEWDAISYDASAEEFMDRLSGSSLPDKQDPIVLPKDKSEVSKIPFPPGVPSLSDWGSTVCRLPRVNHLNASYEELTRMPDQQPYLKWVAEHGMSRGGRFEDFALYLKASKLPVLSAEQCFPGTSVIRERKSDL